MSITTKKIASVPHHDLLIAEHDDIVIVVPEQGFKDTAEASRVTVAALKDYAHKLGKKCGLVIVAGNLLDQQAESRTVYSDGITPDQFFGITIVVGNPFARVIGNLGLRMSNLKVPLIVAENIDAGVAWLEANRKA